ncbi:NnrS family protein [Aquisalimonas lutea]|uniref:NnrS family protein n=1 Tax=Aquisalimonas lutea TaxID=1327750 RepID=UPI0025B45613|nr:NnrS family protein [Aquisalimonas lutea]MDN3519854.1 NnrS family protein [Aquisalimonas lutea]
MAAGKAQPGAATRRSAVTRHAAEKVFFPAAALYALVAVPASVHGMLSGNPLLPAFATVLGHAHELLFGFALAVAAGFLINRTTTVRLASLFGLWLLARVIYLIMPGSMAALTANAAFAAALAWLVVPQFMKGAKKWRNQAFAPLLLGLCTVLALFHAGPLTGASWLRYLALQEAVLLFALLMLFMGGRIIAPAAAGAIQRAGGHLEARVQPHIEGALLITMALAVGTAAIPGARGAAGALVLLAAVLGLVRLLRWRLWAAAGRPDLWCLGLGYAWLVAGLALLGTAWTTGLLGANTATHAITVGALGTLTTGVMAWVRLNRAKLDPARSLIIPLMAGAIAAATLIRLLLPGDVTALAAASGLWALAYALLLALLVRIPPR